MELSFNFPLRLSDADLDALADAVYARLEKHLKPPTVVEKTWEESAAEFAADWMASKMGGCPAAAVKQEAKPTTPTAKQEEPAPTTKPVVITKDALRDAARAHASKNDLETTRKIMGAQRVDDIPIESYAAVYSELTK
jgi:hypothetical protein